MISAQKNHSQNLAKIQRFQAVWAGLTKRPTDLDAQIQPLSESVRVTVVNAASDLQGSDFIRPLERSLSKSVAAPSQRAIMFNPEAKTLAKEPI